MRSFLFNQKLAQRINNLKFFVLLEILIFIYCYNFIVSGWDKKKTLPE